MKPYVLATSPPLETSLTVELNVAGGIGTRSLRMMPQIRFDPTSSSNPNLQGVPRTIPEWS
jgi:hypothetical protein